MFKNAGAKLMSLAKVIFVIYAVGGVIAGIGAGFGIGGVGGFFVFILIAAFAVFAAWLSVIMLYAFGELCENIRAMREGMGYVAPEAQQVNFSQMASNFSSSVSNAASHVSSAASNMSNRFQKSGQNQSMAASQWICPNCGKPNAPESAFCTGCGCTKN